MGLLGIEWLKFSVSARIRDCVVALLLAMTVLVKFQIHNLGEMYRQILSIKNIRV